MSRPALLVGLLATVLAAQAPVPDAAPTEQKAEDLLARYNKLNGETRANVVRNMERRLQRETDATLQRIWSTQRGKGAYPLAAPAVWFEPRVYAPVATPRTLVAARSEAHRQATSQIRSFECLPDLHAEVFYDWQQGAAVRRTTELTDEQRFANYCNGYPPGTDHAIAQVLATLDSDPPQRRLGSYFAHLYADRQGAVFAGVSLFDAWASGIQIEMPDTDAIAYAQLVLLTQSFVAPLPADRRRDRLYEKMKGGFAAHREHRSLRLAIAATLVAAEPRLEPGYENLINRGHWLWQQHDLDMTKVRDYVAATADRSAFMQRVDEALKQDIELVRTRRQALVDMASSLRFLADQELRAAGG